MVRGSRCGVENCRSRNYEEGEDGYLYCENGHRKGEMIAGDDDDQFETAIRSTTRKKDDNEEVERVSKVFTGAKGIDLYVKCLQLVLRHQLAFLIQKKGLPAELETVVQDLWTLRILQLANKIRSESQESASSQVFSTQESEPESEEDPSTLPSRKKQLRENPTLLDCLSLCYLGIIALRLPVTPGDIYTWTTEEDMPYLNTIRLIPQSMKTRLPPTYHSAFSPYSLLNLRRLYTSYANLQTGFERKFSIVWPALNVPVLLFRFLKDLALPLELYDTIIRLGEKLAYDFALDVKPGQRVNITDLPEARLMSCVVVCVKLLFPFDRTKRHPRSVLEPAATAMDWAAWSRLMQEAKAEGKGGKDRYTNEELTKVEENDVLTMTNDQLDQYLDFYVTNFLDETSLQSNGAVDDFHTALYDMFPVTLEDNNASKPPSVERQSDRKLALVREAHGATKTVEAVSSDQNGGVLRPGARYTQDTKESALLEHAKIFYEEAAGVAGLTMDMLIRCVRHIERRLFREKVGMQKLEAQMSDDESSTAEE